MRILWAVDSDDVLGCVKEKPSTPDDKKMYPVQRYGVVANSIGFLVNAQDATVAGPMASKCCNNCC